MLKRDDDDGDENVLRKDSSGDANETDMLQKLGYDCFSGGNTSAVVAIVLSIDFYHRCAEWNDPRWT